MSEYLFLLFLYFPFIESSSWLNLSLFLLRSAKIGLFSQLAIILRYNYIVDWMSYTWGQKTLPGDVNIRFHSLMPPTCSVGGLESEKPGSKTPVVFSAGACILQASETRPQTVWRSFLVLEGSRLPVSVRRRGGGPGQGSRGRLDPRLCGPALSLLSGRPRSGRTTHCSGTWIHWTWPVFIQLANWFGMVVTTALFCRSTDRTAWPSARRWRKRRACSRFGFIFHFRLVSGVRWVCNLFLGAIDATMPLTF